jgi:hypothetical protein
VPGFLAGRDSLGFANTWPSQPDLILTLPLPGRPAWLRIGDASNGICGGMVFAVRDYFEAGVPPPPDTTPPAAGSVLYAYLVKRLFDSFDLPRGALRYYRGMTMPDEDRTVLTRLRRGIAGNTVTAQWPALRACLDAGRLCPLGLVTVKSPNPGRLGRCHQVLAYAYELEGSALQLKVWDPNTEPCHAGSVRLWLDIARPRAAMTIHHNVAIAHPIRGFFVSAYTWVQPPALTGP